MLIRSFLDNYIFICHYVPIGDIMKILKSTCNVPIAGIITEVCFMRTSLKNNNRLAIIIHNKMDATCCKTVPIVSFVKVGLRSFKIPGQEWESACVLNCQFVFRRFRERPKSEGWTASDADWKGKIFVVLRFQFAVLNESVSTIK